MRALRSVAPIALAILAALVLVSGCKDRRTRIYRILQNPDAYMDRTVLIGGEVVKVRSVDLYVAEPSLYQVDDGTAAIWVLSKYGAPREGRMVGVKGYVSSPIRVLGERWGAMIRETDRRVKD